MLLGGAAARQTEVKLLDFRRGLSKEMEIGCSRHDSCEVLHLFSSRAVFFDVPYIYIYPMQTLHGTAIHAAPLTPSQPPLA